MSKASGAYTTHACLEIHSEIWVRPRACHLCRFLKCNEGTSQENPKSASSHTPLVQAAGPALQHRGAMYAESTVSRKLKMPRASSPLPNRPTGVSPRTWSPTVRRRHVSAVVSPPRRLSFAIEPPRSPAEHYYVASPSSDRLPPEVGFLDYHDVAIALRHYGIEASLADAKHLLRQYGHPEGKLIDVVAFEELLHDLGVGSEYPAVNVEDPERAALAIALREASEKRIAMAAEKRMARAIRVRRRSCKPPHGRSRRRRRTGRGGCQGVGATA